MAEIYDLSNLGASQERAKVRLPDGNEYEVIGQSDVNAAEMARLQSLSTLMQGGTFTDEQVTALRDIAHSVCPSVPDEIFDTLSFQVLMGIVGVFTLGAQAGLAPQVQAIFDKIQEEQAGST